LLVPDVDELEPLLDELDDEPFDVLLPELLLLPPDDLAASLANVISCAACTPVGDGSLTLIAHSPTPLAFCAAVGGQYALALLPIFPSFTV
jgi:hypothetical protein